MSYEDPSEDQLVPIAISSFHDDPYMKVMQAYYATNELPIPPPPAPIAPPPSPIAGLQKKQIGHDDEVVLACVRISTLEMKSRISRMAPKRTSTSATLAMTQAAIRKLVVDSVATALEAQAANMANVKKMEDEFYILTVKGNDLKTYVRRFQELAVLCPTMVPNSEKIMEVFIRGLPRSIEGNVTASKP
nr:reverse transcriptase domain-containing protein [Tanacetum cinerariifolium]